MVQLQVESKFLSTAPSNSSFDNGNPFSCIAIYRVAVTVGSCDDRNKENIYNHSHEAKIFKQEGTTFKMVDTMGAEQLLTHELKSISKAIFLKLRN